MVNFSNLFSGYLRDNSNLAGDDGEGNSKEGKNPNFRGNVSL